MANKNPPADTTLLAIDDTTKASLTFSKAVYELGELGLKLIEDYRAGKCADRNKTLESIIEIFKVAQRPFLGGGTINEFGI